MVADYSNRALCDIKSTSSFLLCFVSCFCFCKCNYMFSSLSLSSAPSPLFPFCSSPLSPLSLSLSPLSLSSLATSFHFCLATCLSVWLSTISLCFTCNFSLLFAMSSYAFLSFLYVSTRSSSETLPLALLSPSFLLLFYNHAGVKEESVLLQLSCTRQ